VSSACAVESRVFELLEGEIANAVIVDRDLPPSVWEAATVDALDRAVPLVIASGVCEVLGFFSYTAGSRHGIAVAAVLSSQFAVLAGIAAYVLFGERLSRVQMTGVCTVIAGVALLSALQA